MKHLTFTILFLLVYGFSANAQRILPLDNSFNSLCNINDWNALKTLYEFTNGDNWRIRDGWEDISASQSDPPNVGCDLSKLYGVTLNANGRVVKVDLNPGNKISQTNVIDDPLSPAKSQYHGLGNNLRSSFLPEDLSLLTYLEYLDLGSNYLEGTLPDQWSNLIHLQTLILNENDLTGDIPKFINLSFLDIGGNQFTCQNIENYMHFNNSLPADIFYSPQYFEHQYQAFIADLNQANNLTVDFSNIVEHGGSYKWMRNDDLLGSTQSPILNLTNITPDDAGIYTFHILNNCLDELYFISKPVYVIYPGYDFSGTEVVTNQIMVEFDNSDDTNFFQREILYPNSGFVADQCNCNRELYLWEFPGEEDLAQAIIEIDAAKKLTTIDDDQGEVDGGFNNIIVLNESTVSGFGGYTVPKMLELNENYNDAVDVFALDTGLEDSYCINTSYSQAINTTDLCYDNTVNADDQGHGTIGYNLLSDGFPNTSNIKVSSIKTFDSNGKGNLYDMVCDIYHSIDYNANIINISAGYYGQESTILTEAVNTARKQNIFICAAAGNEENNIDIENQYPACYAGLYHKNYDSSGNLIDSIRFKNVISVAALTADQQMATYSNYGQRSVTLACFGNNLEVSGLGCASFIANGTSFATFIVSRFLALEVAKDNNRNLNEIWFDFQNNMLKFNENLSTKTITGKMLDVDLLSNSNRISSQDNKSENDNLIETNLINTISDYTYLNYRTFISGTISIALFDLNGQLVRMINEGNIYKSKQVQIPISKNMLKKSIYYLNINFQSDIGEKWHKVIQFPVL